jgi:hypothetical protein
VTLESTVRAAGAIPRPGLWAIGRDHQDGVPDDFEVNWDDWRRDTVWAETMLARHGVGRGTPVLIVGGMEESPWFDPFEHAVLNLGGHYCLGETHAFDAFRSALYARCLDVEVIVGINRAVVEGFGDKLRETLGHARVILARPDTMPLFNAAGLTAAIITRVGPALAVECAPGFGTHINGSEWSVDEAGGELLLTTVGPRAHVLDHARVSVRGTIRTDACACGRADPRVDVDPARPV